MLIDTTYSVEFPISHLRLKGGFSPQPGLTAVIGPNGVGKTFGTIELTRYLLYGKAALRGSAPDYKKLEAKGTFLIRGARYQIERRPKKEQITDNQGIILAVGTDSVNKKVVELMGYGLKVFDIANASIQKKADAFGQMQPSERKKLIDEVVGLSANEHVEKACRTEASGLRREAEALARQLRVPIEPEQPADYIPSADLEPRVAELKAVQSKADQITARMGSYPEPAIPPNTRPEPADIENLIEHQSQFNAIEGRRLALENEMSDVFLHPSYTRQELEVAQDRLKIKAVLENAVTCPKCGTEFTPGHEHVVLVEGPDLSQTEINQQLRAIEAKERYERAFEEYETLPEIVDRSAELVKFEQLEEEWRRFDARNEAYEHQVKLNAEAMEALRQLGEVPGYAVVDNLQEQLYESRLYEDRLSRYESDQIQFKTLSEQIAEKERLAGEFKKGADELAAARADLKTVLSPVLSQVASRLIDDMTHGKLSSVYVDEEMEITVDGQSIKTLSGGGETVANIALRLALGQVLVAQTFPVFFGDEMDADADDIRREAIAEAMRALIDKGHLKQIILITHRSVDLADHVIDFGDTG